MIILDLSNILVASLMANIAMSRKAIAGDPYAVDGHEPMSQDYLRFMVLNSIRVNYKQFKQFYGPEMIIACDGDQSWRHSSFPYYKQARRNARDASGLYWPSYFKYFKQLQQEMKHSFPFPIIRVEDAEADDVIGTIVRRFHKEREVLIISCDKDFLQLQALGNVKQFSPRTKEFLTCDDPHFLIDHIIKGDSGDGIPNVLSDDDTFVVSSKAQQKMSKQRIEAIKQALIEKRRPIITLTERVNDKPSKKELDVTQNLKRNKRLIDLSSTPLSIQEAVWAQYIGQEVDPLTKTPKIIDYIMQHNLKQLLGCVGDFT